MVAETQPPAVLPAKPPRMSTGNRFSEVTRATIRRLYIVAGHNPAQIAIALSLKPQQVRNLVAKEGWARLKAGKADSRKQQINDKLLARAQEDQNRVVEASAILAEDLQLSSLNLCAEYVTAKDPKSLQMASGAARNFVQISTMLRNPAQRGAIPGPSGNGTTLIFVGALERAQPKELKQVEPAAIEVSAKTPELT